MCNDHNVSVYIITKSKPIFTVSAGNDSISIIRWSRKINDLRFAAITARSVQFWSPADSSKKLFKNGAFGPNNQQTKFNCVAFDDDGVCYTGGANGAVHCWDQRGELGMVLKAHSSECMAVVGQQGTLVSSGKDFRLCIHTYNKGVYEFVKHIDLENRFISSALDYLDGSILIGYDNGVIATCDLETDKQVTHSVSHYEGEVWGLEINADKGTFYTSGDDNQFMEFDIMNR
jgi:WD40 repeat protein